MASRSEGGVEIEKVAQETPKIIKVEVDLFGWLIAISVGVKLHLSWEP